MNFLRVEHGYYPGPKFKLFYSQPGCRLQFLTYAGFRKHLNSVHSSVQEIAHTLAAVPSSNEPVASSYQTDVLEDQINPRNECSSSSVIPKSSDLVKIQPKKCVHPLLPDYKGVGFLIVWYPQLCGIWRN